MRRFAIFAAALLLVLPGRSAQSQVKLAVTGGANLSTLDFDNPWTWHGGALGVAFEFPVSDMWSIQLAGGISGKGYWEEYDQGGCENRSSCAIAGGISLIYLEFMVLSDRRIELSDRVRMHLLAGPFSGYQDGRRHTRPFDFGVATGALVEVELHGNWGFQAGTLYTHGLRDTGPIFEGYPYDQTAGEKTRTLTLRGGLSYSIR